MGARRRYGRDGRPDDTGLVMDAAALLRVREYDLFRLAWRRWSGKEPDEKALETCFAAYMFRHAVPAWVRHLCREVLARETDGRLDPADFGVERAARHEPPGRFGKAYVAAVVAVMLVLYPALLSITYQPESPAPLACETGPGLRIFAGLAHALVGREPPACRSPGPRDSADRAGRRSDRGGE